MKLNNLRLLSLSACLLFGLQAAALAESIPSSLIPATSIAQPVDGIGSPVEAILYTNDSQTGFRYNPGAAGTTIPADNRRVAFDDVPIPDARLGGNTSISVDRITVGIRRGGSAPATDVNVYVAGLSTGPTAPDTELDSPGTLVGTVSLPINPATGFVTELVSVVPTSPLIVPLNTTLFPGFGSLAVGVNLSSTDTLNGWRITQGPDANANVFWQYDPGLTGQANPEAAFLFDAGTPPNPPATFYIVLEGTPVPEPSSMLGLGGLLLLVFRRAVR